MNEKENLDLFIKDCVLLANEESEEKFLGWESLIAILIYQGFKLMLPEVKEWLKIGTEAIALKRQEIKKDLLITRQEMSLISLRPNGRRKSYHSVSMKKR